MVSAVNTSPAVSQSMSASSSLRASSSAAAGAGDGGQLFGRQVVDVLVHRSAGIDLVLNTVDGGHQDGAERQVGAAAGVGAAELEAAGLVALHQRDTHGGGAVGGAVGQVHRSFVARNQTSVAVLGGVGEALDGAAVLEHTTDGVESGLAELAVAVTGEGVLAVLADGHVAVHTGAIVTDQMGLGMKVAVLPCW